MEAETTLVRTVRPVWISLGESGYEITTADYTTRAQVDLMTLEILQVASSPCTPERIAAWVGGLSPSTVSKRVHQLVEDGFLTTEPATDDSHVWWERWGPEAQRMDAAGRRVRFLPNDDDAVLYKIELGPLPAPLGAARDAELPIARGPQTERSPAEVPIDYWDVVDGRRSAHRHTGRPLEPGVLHVWLSATFAVRELCETVGLGVTTRKRFASAGGRHELVVWVVDLTIADGPNVMKYEDVADQLVATELRMENAQVDAATGNQGLADGASAAVLVATDLDEASWKYRGPAGYRTALVNVGFAGQLALQNAHALGLQVRVTDSVDHATWSKALGLPQRVHPTLVLTLSCKDLSALPEGNRRDTSWIS